MRLKKYKIEIILFIVTFSIMLIALYLDHNVFIALYKYLTDTSAKESLTVFIESTSIFPPIIYLLLRPFITNQPFDHLIIWGTNFFQLLISFLSSIACYIFAQNHININQMKYYRKKKMFKTVLLEILKCSFKIAFSIFLGYFCFYLISIIGGIRPTPSLYQSGILPRTLFLDWLGNDFYFNFAELYWILEGIIRFFLVPFQYAFISCVLFIFTRSIKYSYILCNSYYVFLSAILGAVDVFSFPFKLDKYLDPSVIMASGSYDLATLPLLFYSFLPFFVCLILLHIFRRKVYE